MVRCRCPVGKGEGAQNDKGQCCDDPEKYFSVSGYQIMPPVCLYILPTLEITYKSFLSVRVDGFQWYASLCTVLIVIGCHPTSKLPFAVSKLVLKNMVKCGQIWPFIPPFESHEIPGSRRWTSKPPSSVRSPGGFKPSLRNEMLLATVPRGCHGKHTFGFRLPLMLAHRASDWSEHRKV